MNVYTGTKGVARALKKITAGPARERGVKWFPELVDKRMWMSKYVYYTNQVL